MLNPLTFALALTLACATLAAPLNDSPLQATNITDTPLGIDPGFKYHLEWKTGAIDGTSFYIACMTTAVQLSFNGPHTIIRLPQAFRIPDYPGVTISLYLGRQPLETRFVIYGLFNAVVDMSARPSFTEAGMRLEYRDQLVGVLTFRSTTGLASEGDTTEFGDLGIGPPQAFSNWTNDLTILPAANAAVGDDDLIVLTNFVSTTVLNPARVFIVIMNTIVSLSETGVIAPSSVFRNRNAVARAEVDIGPPNGQVRRRAPYMTPQLAIRTLGRIPFYMIDKNSWREIRADSYLNNGVDFIATTRLEAWDPPNEIASF